MNACLASTSEQQNHLHERHVDFLGATSKRRGARVTVHTMVSFDESLGVCQHQRKDTVSESVIDAFTAGGHCCCRAVPERSVS